MSVYIPVVPEEAPFSSTQRAWLNGFFAGLMGGEVLEGAVPAATPAAEDFPWHDPALELAERLALAKDRPAPRRLMAAMAQLDCGQCGYLCQSYAEAIAAGAEKSLGKCVPGGKETSKALRALLAETPAAAPTIVAEAPHPPGRLVAEAVFRGAAPLNGAGSAKDTRHVVFDLSGSGLDYQVGDAFGLFAEVDPALVDATVAALGAEPDRVVEFDGQRATLRETLTRRLDIACPGDNVVELFMKHAPDDFTRAALAKILDGADDACLADPDLLDLLHAFPSVRPELDAVLGALESLQPRLYSIASSPKAHPGEVHLTVGIVRYARNARDRSGVASTFLADRLAPGARLKAFVQPAHGFRLPADGTKPAIMIGPGTGIAPFRAFLEERRATAAKGRNWLFFGDQRAASDFIYRDEIEGFLADRTLTRLDLAFSRDQAAKIYVQDRMREAGAELWAWLQAGAHVYVCGDASRMARDVDAALQEVVVAHGGMDAGAAKAFVQKLAADRRYQRDVY